MAIKDWHWGKLVLCWIAGLSAVSIGFGLANEIPYSSASLDQKIIVYILTVGGTIVAPVVLFVLTWKWLSGKEPRSSRGTK